MSPSGEDVLKEFEEAEDAAFKELLLRLGQAEDELRLRSGKAAGLLSQRFAHVRSRLDDAARLHKEKVEKFRRELTEGPPDEDAYRARLVMLDMEYASRLRLAEEGLGLITDWAAEREAETLSWSKRLIEGVRTALETRVRPARMGPKNRLQEAERILREKELEIKDLKNAPRPPDLSGRVAELEDELRRSEKTRSSMEERAAERVAAEKDAQARIEALNSELSEARARAERSEESCRTLADRASMRAEAEREALDKARELERELSRMRQEAETSQAAASELARAKESAAAATEARRRAEEALAVSEERRQQAETRAAEAETRAAEAEISAAKVPEKSAAPEPSSGDAAAMAALKEERDDWEERCRNARAAAQHALEEARAEIIQATAAELEGLRSRLRQAQLELETERKRRAALEARAEDSAAADPEELEELSRHLSRSHEEVRAWQAKTLRSEKERDAARGEAARSVAEIESLGQQRDALRERVFRMHESLERIPQLEKAIRGLLADRAELMDRLNPGGAPPAARPAPAETEAALKGLRGELEAAHAETAEVREKLDAALKDLKAARELGQAMQKRIMAADVHKDKSHDADRVKWLRERSELQEELAQKSRQLTVAKNQLDAIEKNWRDTMIKQDSERLKEIFQLKSELEKLRKKGG